MTAAVDGPMGEVCCDDLLAGPEATDEARRLGVLGFLALWRGASPAIADLCDNKAVIASLVAGGRLELDAHGTLIGVHGLSARPTAHQIQHEHGAVHTWCALDAIGIPAALGIDAIAVTTCPTCGAQLRVALHEGTPEAGGNRRLWLPDTPSAHLVEDFCRHANLYCSPEHLRAMVSDPSSGRPVSVADAAVVIGRTTWHDVVGGLDDSAGDGS